MAAHSPPRFDCLMGWTLWHGAAIDRNTERADPDLPPGLGSGLTSRPQTSRLCFVDVGSRAGFTTANQGWGIGAERRYGCRVLDCAKRWAFGVAGRRQWIEPNLKPTSDRRVTKFAKARSNHIGIAKRTRMILMRASSCSTAR